MRDKKISIIIPVYNVEKYLRQCLESVINQTYDNLEIICVNNESTDNSLKILEEYALRDSRIKIINEKNTGVSAARNAGIEASTGEYAMFVDSDDWIDEESCEVSIDLALKHDAEVILWPYIREFYNNPQPKKIFDENIIIFTEPEVKKRIHRRFCGLIGNELRSPENADSVVTVWGKLYKTELIKRYRIQFVDLKLIGTSEDALFNFFLFNHVSKAVYINKYFYHYRKDNEKSLTQIARNKPKLFAQWSYLFDLIEKNIEDNKLSETYREAINNRIALSIVGLGLNELAAPKPFFLKIQSIREMITNPRYKEAYKNLQFRYFPIHWKTFFFCAKYGLSTGVYMLLIIIKFMIGR